MASQVRERIKSLFAAVEKIVSSEALENEPPAVPEQFLQGNNIRLVSHDLTIYENWVNQQPPIFFKRFTGFKDHPVYDYGIEDPKDIKDRLTFHQIRGRGRINESRKPN